MAFTGALSDKLGLKASNNYMSFNPSKDLLKNPGENYLKVNFDPIGRTQGLYSTNQTNYMSNYAAPGMPGPTGRAKFGSSYAGDLNL